MIRVVMLMITLLLALTPTVLVPPALALTPEEQLEDPALEARARALSLEFRCVVCAGQSIADSNATVARDMRAFLRRSLVQGATDEQVRNAMVIRYNEAVLLAPRFNWLTSALWLSPLVLVLLAAGVLGFRYLRSGQAVPASPHTDTPLTEAEKAELADLLGPADDDRKSP